MSTNQKLFDMMVRHAVGLERLKAGTVKELLVLFEEVERDLIAKLRKINPKSRSALVLRQILADTREKRIAAYGRLKELLGDNLEELAKYEGVFITEGLRRTTPLAGLIAAPSVDVLVQVVRTELRGDLLNGWIKEARDADVRRVTRAIRIGIAEGENLQGIIARTGASDKTARRHVETVIRTTISDVTTKAREEVYKVNKKYIKRVLWRSVLDNRTTAICMSRDGQDFPIDSGPRPPAHPNCRSITTPVTRTWDELSPSAQEALAKLPKKQRSALGGPVDSDITYAEWVKTQPKWVQEDALGKTRAALFRKGDLPLDRYIDPTGRFYTLNELRQKEAFSDLFKDLNF